MGIYDSISNGRRSLISQSGTSGMPKEKSDKSASTHPLLTPASPELTLTQRIQEVQDYYANKAKASGAQPEAGAPRKRPTGTEVALAMWRPTAPNKPAPKAP